MKASLSHLEFENRQLRGEVATLKAENRQIEDRLVQEESANGELSARLDDARALLTRRGINPGEGGLLEPEPPATTLPAGQSNRTRRKPPFARIPGSASATDPDEAEPEKPSRPRPSRARDIGPQGRRDLPTQWLPVASGAMDPTSASR
jgi:hypothetical protein